MAMLRGHTSHEFEAELRALDLEALTPLAALNLLHELQARAKRTATRPRTN